MSGKEAANNAGQSDASQNNGPASKSWWPWQKREAYDAAYANEKDRQNKEKKNG